MTRTGFAALGTIVLLGAAASGLQGCAVAAVGAAGVGGAAVGADERGVGGVARDTRIRTDINAKWFDHNLEMMQRVNMQVREGRVLLTGRVPTPEMRLDAVRLAWEVDGVTEVINELQVEDPASFGTYASDSWIDTQLRARLIGTEGLRSVNYSIETVNGVVYLMGIARDQAELDRVVNIARNMRNVRQVVSYVRLDDRASARQ